MEETALQKLILANTEEIDSVLEDIECQREGHFTQFGHNARNASTQEQVEEIIKDALEFTYLMETKLREISQRLQDGREPLIVCRHCKKQTFASEKCLFCYERPHERLCVKVFFETGSYNDCTCEVVK